MLTPIGAFVTAIVTSAVASVVLPIVALGLIVAGITFMLGNHEHGKTRATWALFGGAIALMANTLATALGGAVPH